MLGETLRCYTNIATQNTYEALVIGLGISGGWAAKELTEKGLKELMRKRGEPGVYHRL